MELKLLEIGQNTEQLSSCRISLILGVYTSDNLLDTFCKVARKVLASTRSPISGTAVRSVFAVYTYHRMWTYLNIYKKWM